MMQKVSHRGGKFPPKLARIGYMAVMVVALLLATWVAFLCINRGPQMPMWLLMITFFAVLLLIGGYYVYVRFLNDHRRLVALEIICILSVLFGVVARLVFLKFSSNYMPTGEGSDTGIHWYLAQEILADGKITTPSLGIYEGFFPYLTTYTGFMALMMKIFGVNYAAILIPNVICDLLVGVMIYILLKRWQNQRIALIGVALWMVNPLGIAFCAEGLALTLTNLIIMAVIFTTYFFYLALKEHDYRKTITLAALIGICLAFGNAVRSVFTILLIAVLLLLVVLWLRKPTKKLLFTIGSSIIMLFVTFYAGGNVMTIVQQNLNPYYENTHGGLGWSLFVGANRETHGRWSEEDWDFMPPRLYSETMTMDDTNAEFTELAMQRYKEMGLPGLAIHLANKSAVLFTRNDINVIRNFEEQFTNVGGFETWYLTLNDLCLWMLEVFVFLMVIYYWRIASVSQKQQDNFALFLVLCFCGLLMGSLLVEVMSRYVAIFLVPLVIFGACALRLPKKWQSLHTES